MNPVHLAFVAMIALIFLGPKKLPELARSIGSGMREFRESMNIDHEDGAAQLPGAAGTVTPAEPVATVQHPAPVEAAPVEVTPVVVAPVVAEPVVAEPVDAEPVQDRASAASGSPPPPPAGT
jgi:sec-independent protein translocase protein TatA